MVLTRLAERRNSPSSGRPSTSRLGRWAQQILYQRVDRPLHLAPRAPGFVKAGSFASLALLSHHVADTLELLGHVLVRGNDIVEGIRNLP